MMFTITLFYIINERFQKEKTVSFGICQKFANYINKKDRKIYSLFIIVVEAIFATGALQKKLYPAMQVR